MKQRTECTHLQLVGADKVIDLIAVDCHGNGRSNKAWISEKQRELEIDLPNLKAVASYAKEHGLKVEKLYD